MARMIPADRKVLIIITLVFLTIGLIFAITGCLMYYFSNQRMKSCTEEVQSTVIDLRARYSDTSVTYAPVFSYEYGGQVYEHVSSVSSNPPAFDRGQQVTIFVDPADPEKIYVPEDKSLRIISIVFTAIGSLFALIGLVVLIVLLRSGHRQSLDEMEAYEHGCSAVDYDPYRGE